MKKKTFTEYASVSKMNNPLGTERDLHNGYGIFVSVIYLEHIMMTVLFQLEVLA